MSIEKKDDSPFGIKASKKNDDIAAYEEMHRKIRKGAYYEDSAEEARQEIIEHYKIPPENVAIFPEIEGGKREIRIFMVLENQQTGERFYADGHVPHATVLNFMFQKFPQIGIGDRLNLPDDWDEKWKTRKGFIDPYLNGFRDFPHTRKAIIRAMETKDQNHLTEKQIEILKKEPENGDIDLPNWIKSI